MTFPFLFFCSEWFYHWYVFDNSTLLRWYLVCVHVYVCVYVPGEIGRVSVCVYMCMCRPPHSEGTQGAYAVVMLVNEGMIVTL